ncbi:MAG: NfeD family protein [Burkholderiales bacterium]|nr:NfeD family protein [Burkholderiales bacterium]
MDDLDPALAWAVLGLTLVVIELLAGTFYLLVLGVAAFGAAAAAWAEQDFAVQALVFGAMAAAGCYGVYAYRAREQTRPVAPLDAGQPATFETWIDEGARLARVRYRDATWEAVVEEDASPAAGAVVYITGARGNTLRVSARRPH